MNAPVQIDLFPSGQVVRVARGTLLQDALFAYGVEFPCGGRGRCKGCKIRIRSGALPVTEADETCLSAKERTAGWRLACRATAEADLQIELAQWEIPILSDDSTFSFKPRPGLGVAVDLGSTTIVAQLLDLQTGHVLGVATALNDQAKHGADIMTRVEFALTRSGQETLKHLVRNQIQRMIHKLLAQATVHQPSAAQFALESIILVGNTVMHHLFCGNNVERLSRYPFESKSNGIKSFASTELGWTLPGNPAVHFLPCLGGFVGSDLLAGVMATHMGEREPLMLLIDLGTNGEIVLGNQKGFLCCATAAGPAFEGARISVGMRAATGAISEVRGAAEGFCCRVLGNITPRGICGSGLVDALAASLDFGLIASSGRLTQSESLKLAEPVSLNQRDIRELQLAKGAIAAGIRLLLARWGARADEVEKIFLAGAFGNYINRTSARRIGLLRFPTEKIVPSGNTALLGAKLALFDLMEADISYPELVGKTTHVSLSEEPDFQEVYAEEMAFP